ncbi:MAG: hypothetical protein Q7O66_16495 [Dehalococcoidia bacterium]|nr:hypothetical protein [Dehalococcoidia bacterium]
MKHETAQSAHEPVYEVVWPLARTAAGAPIKPSPAIADLNGKTIGELWDYRFKGDRMFAIIRDSLRQRFPDVKFVDYSNFGDIHGPDEVEVISALPGLLRKHGVDAVITGVAS